MVPAAVHGPEAVVDDGDGHDVAALAAQASHQAALRQLEPAKRRGAPVLELEASLAASEAVATDAGGTAVAWPGDVVEPVQSRTRERVGATQIGSGVLQNEAAARWKRLHNTANMLG